MTFYPHGVDAPPPDLVKAFEETRDLIAAAKSGDTVALQAAYDALRKLGNAVAKAFEDLTR